MHPAAIVSAAVGAGLDGFALCDHNAADNVVPTGRAVATVNVQAHAGL